MACREWSRRADFLNAVSAYAVGAGWISVAQITIDGSASTLFDEVVPRYGDNVWIAVDMIQMALTYGAPLERGEHYSDSLAKLISLSDEEEADHHDDHTAST